MLSQGNSIKLVCIHIKENMCFSNCEATNICDVALDIFGDQLFSEGNASAKKGHQRAPRKIEWKPGDQFVDLQSKHEQNYVFNIIHCVQLDPN